MRSLDESDLDELGRAAIMSPPVAPSSPATLRARVDRRRRRRMVAVAATLVALLGGVVVQLRPDAGDETVVAGPPSDEALQRTGVGDALWPAPELRWSFDELLSMTTEHLLRWPPSTTWRLEDGQIDGATIVTGVHPTVEDRVVMLLVADDGDGWRIVATPVGELRPVLDEDGRLTGLRSDGLADVVDGAALGPEGPIEFALWSVTAGVDEADHAIVFAEPIVAPVGGSIVVTPLDDRGEATTLLGVALGAAERLTADLDALYAEEPPRQLPELMDRDDRSPDPSDVRAILDLDDEHHGYVALVDGEVCWFVHSHVAEHLGGSCAAAVRFNEDGIGIGIGGPRTSITTLLIPEGAVVSGLPDGYEVHPSGLVIVGDGPGTLSLSPDGVVEVTGLTGAD